MTITRLDLTSSTLSHLYKPSAKQFSLVEAPPLNYLMIDGQSDPAAQEFKDAVEALYSVSYPLKFASKKELGMDYTVMPLQRLWWADDFSVFTGTGQRDLWKWTAMILQPEHITRDMVDRAIATAGKKKRSNHPPAASRVHSTERAGGGRQAPRNLPERPSALCAGENEDDPPPAG